MPIFPDTPLRRIRSQELEAESYMDVDSCGSEVSGSERRPQSFDLMEDPSFWKDNNVQVVIRIRPLSSSEISLQGQNRCVRQDSCQSITWTGHPESRFTFDHVAGEMISQEQLFKVAGVPMVDNCVAGYNSCMFAYGQTGSGKTHTMLGDIEGGTRRHSVNAGMTPRVFEYLFSRIQKEREVRKEDKLRFICKCSFLEIYNEQILDLLDPSSNNLQIREDARKGIYVENLTEFEVSCARDVIQQLVQGAANRKVASTNMNRASSRSHSVFTCTIESKWESQGVMHHRFARLNLVDLAGSERQKSSGAEGERLKEATNINKSLSTLGLVIMNLVSISNKKSLHVPYRDSKLTFLLQDSLGGNSKTIIIANISPSNCCTLETLSTLKFAQRAKFIRNNAIINEDASGDVIAMRLQIQQLKKEVNRLHGLANGGHGNLETDSMSFAITDSPGSFKWDGSFSPLTFNNKLSQRKEYETILAAAIRRDQEKEKALNALNDEKQAAEQLASQRSDEVQGLKMRLRFREERIKRLEAMSSGKLSAEAHLLKEKEELLKELEILRNQADRNRDAIRFAMENLQLKEELRRLQSFVEEGERDMMNAQIKLLQDKLLEALDWKLMHEKDADAVKGPLDFSSTNEEMEFLQLQAIQNKMEVDALRKNLSSCLEAKEKLERRVDELVLQLEEQSKTAKSKGDGGQSITSCADGSSDQFELKAMVEAIATASQREAEAHETAIMLVKENEELHAKLKVLIDDNNKLIELCENLSSEGADNKNTEERHVQDQRTFDTKTMEVENVKHQLDEMHEENEKLMGLYEQAMHERDLKTKTVKQFEHQLQEMHEENEKLMGLYEQAMHERDVKAKNADQLEHQVQELHEENMKLIGLHGQAMQERDVKAKNADQLEHTIRGLHDEIRKLTGLYGQAMQERDDKARDLKQVELLLQKMHQESEKLTGLYVTAIHELNLFKGMLYVSEQNNKMEVEDEIFCPEKLVEVDGGESKWGDKRAEGQESKPDPIELAQEHLNTVQSKLDIMQKKFKNATETTGLIMLFERETKAWCMLIDKLKTTGTMVQQRQHGIASVRSSLSDIQDRRSSLEKKFLVLQASFPYTKLRALLVLEHQSQARVDAISIVVERKEKELLSIQSSKEETEAKYLKAIELESQLREDLALLKIKYQEAENKKKDTERVLFAIDNFDKKENSLQLGKASELLKSEEERTKLAIEIKRSRDKLVKLHKEISSSKEAAEALEAKISDIKMEVRSSVIMLQECMISSQNIVEYKENLLERMDHLKTEVDEFLIDFQETLFESELKEAEICACSEELETGMQELEKLKASRDSIVEKWNQLFRNSHFVGEAVQGDLEDLHEIVLKTKSLLSSSNAN